jgi:hypothetical protein
LKYGKKSLIIKRESFHLFVVFKSGQKVIGKDHDLRTGNILDIKTPSGEIMRKGATLS